MPVLFNVGISNDASLRKCYAWAFTAAGVAYYAVLTRSTQLILIRSDSRVLKLLSISYLHIYWFYIKYTSHCCCQVYPTRFWYTFFDMHVFFKASVIQIGLLTIQKPQVIDDDIIYGWPTFKEMKHNNKLIFNLEYRKISIYVWRTIASSKKILYVMILRVPSGDATCQCYVATVGRSTYILLIFLFILCQTG